MSRLLELSKTYQYLDDSSIIPYPAEKLAPERIKLIISTHNKIKIIFKTENNTHFKTY